MWIAPELKLDQNILLRENITEDDLKIMREVGGLNSWAEARIYNNRVPLMKNELVVEFPANQATLTKRYTEESIKFIRKNNNDPFLIYLTPAMPHIPLFASEKFLGKSEAGLYGCLLYTSDAADE